MTVGFGDILREWRKRRRYSQLELSLISDVSARHLSFLETGRSNPSREMVILLAQTLKVPLPQINQALFAAGFSSFYLESATNQNHLQPLIEAMDLMCENHMPYPAFILDRTWNITNANAAATRLMNAIGFGQQSNLIDALIADDPANSAIINWGETVNIALQRLRTESSSLGEDAVLKEKINRLQQHLNASDANKYEINPTQAVLPVKFNVEKQTLTLFSTIAQFGSVLDMTLADMKVEMMFPLDEPTETFFKNAQS